MIIHSFPNLIVKTYSQEIFSFISRQGPLVYKFCPTILTLEWKTNLENFLEDVKISSFHSFIENGYVMKFLKGVDLWGDPPFDYGKAGRLLELSLSQREQVRELLLKIVLSGIKRGMFLADITPRNIILAEEKINLIDFDIFVSKEIFLEVYRPLWQTMLDYLKIPLSFNEGVNELISFLSKNLQ